MPPCDGGLPSESHEMRHAHSLAAVDIPRLAPRVQARVSPLQPLHDAHSRNGITSLASPACGSTTCAMPQKGLAHRSLTPTPTPAPGPAQRPSHQEWMRMEAGVDMRLMGGGRRQAGDEDIVGHVAVGITIIMAPVLGCWAHLSDLLPIQQALPLLSLVPAVDSP